MNIYTYLYIDLYKMYMYTQTKALMEQEKDSPIKRKQLSRVV